MSKGDRARILDADSPGRWAVRRVSYYVLVREQHQTVIPAGCRKPRKRVVVAEVWDSPAYRRREPTTLRGYAVELSLGANPSTIRERLHKRAVRK